MLPTPAEHCVWPRWAHGRAGAARLAQRLAPVAHGFLLAVFLWTAAAGPLAGGELDLQVEEISNALSVGYAMRLVDMQRRWQARHRRRRHRARDLVRKPDLEIAHDHRRPDQEGQRFDRAGRYRRRRQARFCPGRRLAPLRHAHQRLAAVARPRQHARRTLDRLPDRHRADDPSHSLRRSGGHRPSAVGGRAAVRPRQLAARISPRRRCESCPIRFPPTRDRDPGCRESSTKSCTWRTTSGRPIWIATASSTSSWPASKA